MNVQTITGIYREELSIIYRNNILDIKSNYNPAASIADLYSLQTVLWSHSTVVDECPTA